MSAINTSTIDVNYPVPGVNNSSQGFRDNFAGIKNNLNIAGSELSDLQNKAIVKSALTGIALNNDMANTLLSNASTLGFRHTTWNLGNNLSDTVTVDFTKADLHYGTVTGNIVLDIVKWPPATTQGNVQVLLSIANTSASITLPSATDSSAATLENYNSGAITAPEGASEIHLNFISEDCGVSITVEPVNRPRKVTQILPVSALPSNPVPGEIRFNTSSNTFVGWNGTAWVTLA